MIANGYCAVKLVCLNGLFSYGTFAVIGNHYLDTDSRLLNTDYMYCAAASRHASARSVLSHGRSRSFRPKCPYAAV